MATPKDVGGQRPALPERKSSLSNTLNRLAPNQFRRRRTANDLTGPDTLQPFTASDFSSTDTDRESHLPTPYGLQRSSSFFGNLKAVRSRLSSGNLKENKNPSSTLAAPRVQKTFSRLSISNEGRSSNESITPAPTLSFGQERNLSTQIVQHQLLQPLGPPMPRSITMTDLAINDQPKTPGFARPTTSSAARRRDRVVQTGSKTPTSSSASQRAIRPANKGIMTPTSSPTIRHGGPRLLPSRNKTPTSGSYLRHNTTAEEEHHEQEIENLSDSALDSVIESLNEEILNQGVLDEELPEIESTYKAVVGQGFEHDGSSTTAVQESSDIDPVGEDDSPTSMAYIQDESEIFTEPSPLLPATPARVEDQSEIAEPDEEPLSLTIVQTNPREITTAMPAMWWLGRVSALSDRFRTEELNLGPAPLAPSPLFSLGRQPRLGHGMHDDDRRNHRVFAHLRNFCVTDEARNSLQEFRVQYEKKLERDAARERGETLAEMAVEESDDEQEEEEVRVKEWRKRFRKSRAGRKRSGKK